MSECRRAAAGKLDHMNKNVDMPWREKCPVYGRGHLKKWDELSEGWKFPTPRGSINQSINQNTFL